MRDLVKGTLACAVFALCTSVSRAADETITVALAAGDNASIVAMKIEAAWSQIGSAYYCDRVNNTFLVRDRTGDCDMGSAKFVIRIPNGTLGANRTLRLRLRCMSPLESFMDLDLQGLTPLVQGANARTSGGDVVSVWYQNYGVRTTPALPAVGLAAFALLAAGGGVALLRRRAVS